MWGIEEWFILIFIIIGAVWDLVSRCVPMWYLLAGTLLALGYQILLQKETVLLVLFGGITGLLFLLVSKYTEQGIGYGDSWMILNLGIVLGVWKLLVVLAIAFLSAAIIALLGMASHICKRKTKLPFFPFLVIGYIGIYGW